MSKVRFEMDRDGVRALLKCEAMETGLKSLADGVKERCGEGYETDSKQMPTRVIASVYADTDAARKDNLDNNTILRSLL